MLARFRGIVHIGFGRMPASIEQKERFSNFSLNMNVLPSIGIR